MIIEFFRIYNHQRFAKECTDFSTANIECINQICDFFNFQVVTRPCQSSAQTGAVQVKCKSVLTATLAVFVGGFDMEKYLAAQSCADFIVSSPDYFRANISASEYVPEETVSRLRAETEASLEGFGYQNTRWAAAWMPQSTWLMDMARFYGEEQAERTLVNQERRGDTAPQIITIEGLDDTLLEKLVVLDGDLAPLRWAEGHFIAIAADLDDYGNLERPEYYPAVERPKDLCLPEAFWEQIPEMKEGLFILLGFLFVLKMAIDWIQFRDELEEMHDESEQETKE